MVARRPRRAAGAAEPTATYRLQLRQGVTLDDARRAVPYLVALGVSHLYLSPPFVATEGSTHGYDVTDPTDLDPAVGSENDVRALAADLHGAGLGLLLDIVPNHMAASSQNPWWRALLAGGHRSPSARTFDVDLGSLGGKTFLPVLTAPLEEEIAAGAFELDLEGGELRYRGLGLPLSPRSLERLRSASGDVENLDGIRRVIASQHYVLSPWQDEEARRNYRRFFDITDLVGVRQEDSRVFDSTHALIRSWVRAGLVDGLRVDHVDGLRDPLGYLERVRDRIGPGWLLVEKILAPDEDLSPAWPVDGTTGYEAAIDLNDLFVSVRGWERLGRLAGSFRGGAGPGYEEIRSTSRRLALERLFGVEVTNLARALERFAARVTDRPPTFDTLREALVETTTELDVYRTYAREGVVGRADRRRIRAALSGARRRLGARHKGALSVLRRALLVQDVEDPARELAVDILERWQQLTGPVAAKGEEDTALYRDVRLISRNEVGSDPGLVPRSVDELHRRLAGRGRRWPRSMIATSTHDTKRGEDTRARIDVLSELADEWAAKVERWSALNAPLRRNVRGREAPSPPEELALYQTLVGIWPVHGQDRRGLGERVRRYFEKSLREAKVSSSWLEPDERYEQAVFAFASTAIAPRNPTFVDELSAFAERVAFHGAVNSLAQAVMKAVVPGVPDIYQGSEGWNLSLVDPDNREPADLERFERRLASVDGADASSLLERWPSGDVKLFVTARALRMRRERAALFSADARYLPLAASGRRAEHVIAAARRRDRDWVLAVVPRLSVALAPAGTWPIGRPVWRMTSLALPATAPRRWRDVFTGSEMEIRGASATLDVAAALERFPVALLVPARRAPSRPEARARS